MASIEGSGRAAESSCSERCSAFFHSKCFAVALLIVSLALFGGGMTVGGMALFGAAIKFAATLGAAAGMGIFIPCTVLLAAGVIVSIILLVKRSSCSGKSLLSGFSFNNKAFFNAVETGNLEEVKRLVNDQNINAERASHQNDEYTPLQIAAEKGHFDIVKFLVERGANVNAYTPHALPPIHGAGIQQHYEIVEFLLQNGANPNITMRQKITTLYDAVRWGDAKLVELLLKYGADPNIWTSGGNCLDSLGWKPEENKTPTAMVQLLLNYGAKTGAQLNQEASAQSNKGKITDGTEE